MALSGIPIDPQTCIGDSLVTLNDSFIELDSRTLNLSSSVEILSSTFVTTVSSLSSSVVTLIESSGVTEIIAGANITISPLSGKGSVIINSTGGGGGLSEAVKQTFTGNGSQQNFTLTAITSASSNANNYRIDLNGVLQEPSVDYTISGTTTKTVDFTSPPPNGVKIVVVTGEPYVTSVSLTGINVNNVTYTSDITSAITLTADDTKFLKVIVGGVAKHIRLYDIN